MGCMMPKQSRRTARSRYPWRGSFSSRQEVEGYFGSDKIQCLLCGQWLLALGLHLKTHSVSVREYKIRYGLPFNRGLMCEATRQLKSEAVTPEMRLKASKNAATACEISARTRRGKPLYRAPYLHEEAIDNMVSGRGMRRWSVDDFERVLAEIPRRKTLGEIWSDPSLPSRSLWNWYRRENPRYDQRVQRLVKKMRLRRCRLAKNLKSVPV